MTGKDIRAERTKRGISLGTLAKAAGKSDAAVRLIENEEIRPHPSELVDLWNAIDRLVPMQDDPAAENAA
jgi:predicted transcriptional regulator